MAIFETFSKRRKRLEKTAQEDVYQYGHFPVPFRVQVIHILRDTIGRCTYSSGGYQYGNETASGIWKTIHGIIAREEGQFYLGDPYDTTEKQCCDFLLGATAADDILDIIEMSFRVIDVVVRKTFDYQRQARATQEPDDAIAELNQRFREHGIGYQYADGILVRVDSQFLHDQAVKPALALLHEVGFQGASDEFIKAFDYHRKGDSKAAIAEALKAFESTMKGICDARRWSRPANATARPLIEILLSNGLVPKSLESQFTGLRSAMESGLPTISNETSRHGQGAQPVQVPDHFAAYALHLAASNIVFLVQCHKALK